MIMNITKRQRKIISEFEDLNIPQAKGNVIFPNGNDSEISK